MSITRDFPDLPPVWMLGAGVLSWAFSRWLPLRCFDGVATQWLGVALAIAGASLALWAAVWFARKRTTIEPREKPARLIVEGPFRLNRNPIYSGMFLALLGYGLWLGALTALIPPFLFLIVIDRRFVRGEEEALVSSLGDEAARYIAASRRW